MNNDLFEGEVRVWIAGLPTTPDHFATEVSRSCNCIKSHYEYQMLDRSVPCSRYVRVMPQGNAPLACCIQETTVPRTLCGVW